MKQAHEYTDSALVTALSLLERTTPEHPPTDGLLRFVDGLLDRHHAGSPAANVEQRLAELTERLDRLEKATAFTTLNRKK